MVPAVAQTETIEPCRPHKPAQPLLENRGGSGRAAEGTQQVGCARILGEPLPECSIWRRLSPFLFIRMRGRRVQTLNFADRPTVEGTTVSLEISLSAIIRRER